MGKKARAPSAPRPSRAALTIVGTGISIGQMTVEAIACVDEAAQLFALVADPIAFQWLRERNASAESLHRFYAEGKPRAATYDQMVEHVMSHLTRGRRVCLVAYGHPGVFALPPHELIRRCRSAGIPAQMLPGVSAEDCLFADLGVDPGTNGCQSFESTDFLLRNRVFDPTTPLVLWQFGITGELCHPKGPAGRGVQVLAKVLSRTYGWRHKVTLYEAAIYPLCKPLVRHVELRALGRSRYSGMTTLLVPPLKNRPVNLTIARQLGIAIEKPRLSPRLDSRE